MEELKTLFEEVVQQKMSEIKSNASTYGEAKAAAHALAWSKDKVEALVGNEITRRIYKELEDIRVKK